MTPTTLAETIRKMRRWFTRRVDHGALVPTWWGVSWRDYARMQTVCHPLPLNILIGLVYRLYWFIVCPWTEASWQKRFHGLYVRERAVWLKEMELDHRARLDARMGGKKG